MNAGMITMLVVETENWLKKLWNKETLEEADGIRTTDQLRLWFEQCLIRTSLLNDVDLSISSENDNYKIFSFRNNDVTYVTEGLGSELKSLTGFYQLIIRISNRADAGLLGPNSGYTGDALSDCHIDTVALFAVTKAVKWWARESELFNLEYGELIDECSEMLTNMKERMEDANQLNVFGITK